jgi:hypothetical protein
MAGLLLVAADARAQDAPATAPAVVRYVTPDGQIGFADDAARVPAGARVLAPLEPEAGRLQVVETTPSAPAPSTAGSPRAFTEAAEEAAAAERRRREEQDEVRKEIRKAQQELETASTARRASCGNGYYGRRAPHFKNRSACYEATQRQQAAQGKLREIRAQLEESFEDSADFFPEAEAADDDSGEPPPPADAAESEPDAPDAASAQP